MVARYAVKYRRSPYPEATRIKNIQLLAVFTAGGSFSIPSPGQIFCFAEGTTTFTGETCLPLSPPTSHTGRRF